MNLSLEKERSTDTCNMMNGKNLLTSKKVSMYHNSNFKQLCLKPLNF